MAPISSDRCAAGEMALRSRWGTQVRTEVTQVSRREARAEATGEQRGVWRLGGSLCLPQTEKCHGGGAARPAGAQPQDGEERPWCAYAAAPLSETAASGHTPWTGWEEPDPGRAYSVTPSV